MRAYSLEEGERLIGAARHTIEVCASSANPREEAIEKTLKGFDQRHGVFVTIYLYPEHTLRGCIGFIEGIEPIRKLIVMAARAAASEDPRFAQISRSESEHIVIEVSILSEAEKISGECNEIKKQIRVGRDGLIIEYGFYKGLLLPIVAVEEGWNAEEFLENVCI